MSVNKVILIGHLGKDPELRFTSGTQTAVSSFSLATNERKKDPSGNWVESTEWHNVVVFGKTAETCAQYLKKGRQAYIEGRIQTRKWQDKEGRDRYTTEVVANTVQFLGGGAGRSEGQSMNVETIQTSAGNDLINSLPSADQLSAGAGASTGASASFEDDDIPF